MVIPEDSKSGYWWDMNGYDKFKHQVWNMMEPDLCLQNGVLHRFPVIALEEMNEMSPQAALN